VICTSARLKQFLVRDLKKRRLCSSVNSPAITKTLLENHLSAPPEKSWTARWKKRGSIAKKFTSPMRRNISNGSRAGNVASTKSRTREKSRLVVCGLKPSCESLGRSCLSFSAQLRGRQFSDHHFALRASAEKFFHRSSRQKSWPRSILRRCCASRMKNRDTANTKTSSPISGSRSLRRTPTKTSASR